MKKLGLIILALSFVFVASSKADEPPPFYSLHMSLSTHGYVNGVGTVSIWRDQGYDVRVSWDANACSLDQFGNPSRCTKMAAWLFKTKLEAVAKSPNGARLYRFVDSERLNKFRLVLNSRAGSGDKAALLVLNEEGVVTQRIPLKPRF